MGFELKSHEYRVGLTPDNVKEFVKHGHTVLVEVDAGAGAHFDNELYKEAGSELVSTAKEVYEKSEMMI